LDPSEYGSVIDRDSVMPPPKKGGLPARQSTIMQKVVEDKEEYNDEILPLPLPPPKSKGMNEVS
jgi:hypothetical protein